ncbi:hypothetical protein JQ617_15770 [Bradyrhizobium sp. KB893862 SZCCT0404]|uniref:hypothetical protein n=1 Tax=Bradyrhizobium sp. KB893862 SZCCT0404 TaxID=2807672 RepID=UPI001BA98E79|nr:hypothetical protein [Bradyrhizobium sp. KB893862 SZCCT0404]MBR1175419.1 hypothetical protein [Bradyrhizobium sp. KB893862 SZCCT0404]
MKLSELTKGSSVMLAVIVAGYVSTSYVDQNFAEPKMSKWAEPASTSTCVGSDGSWKNWPWPNVPALSPKCK